MSLITLFLYCPKLSHSEDDTDRKVVAFYPEAYDRDQQSMLQGVVEGVSAFISQFSGGNGCELIECEHTMISLLPCGDDCHLVLVVKDGPKNINRQNILKHCFNLFKLLIGPLHISSASEEDIRQLRLNVRKFLICYGECISVESLPLSMTFEGISYLSVDRLVYCSLTCWINKVELLDSGGGKFLCVLYGQRLLWSSSDQHMTFYWLEQDQFSVLKKEHAQEMFTAGSDKRLISALKFYDDSNGEEKWFWAISVNIDQLCFYYRVDEQSLDVGLRLISSLDCLALLSQLKSSSKLRQISEPVRFLYFNGMNLAIKCNIPMTYPESSLQSQCLGILRSMQETFRTNDTTLDIVVQTTSSRWIVGKRFPITKRVYFMLVDELFSNIEQVEAEIARLESTTLSSICLA